MRFRLLAAPVDVVMHFAGLIEAGESMKVPERYFRTNTASTLSLLEAMLRHGVGRLVFSSTAALFGNPERVPIAEDDRSADQRLRRVEAAGGADAAMDEQGAWAALRLPALFQRRRRARPRQWRGPSPGIAPDPAGAESGLGQREKVSIFGRDYPTPDGTCVRDYVHVDDLARRTCWPWTRSASIDRWTTISAMARAFRCVRSFDVARAVTGHPIPAVEAPRRAGDPAILVASSARSGASWAGDQKSGAQDIIASAWEWHRRHPHGYDGCRGRDSLRLPPRIAASIRSRRRGLRRRRTVHSAHGTARARRRRGRTRLRTTR